MKYLLIVVSACFLLTCTTSCENGKNANDKNASEEVTEKNVDEEVKDDASALAVASVISSPTCTSTHFTTMRIS